MGHEDARASGSCPASAPGDAPEHDWDLFEMNRTEHVYRCMLCDAAIRVPVSFGPEDVAKGGKA